MAGCGTKTETATEEVQQETKEEPAAKSTAESSTDTQAVADIAVGPTEGKSEEDYKFAGVFGAVNPYSDPMQGAADQAASELGIPATDFSAPQNWEQNEQNTILDGMIAKGMKGI